MLVGGAALDALLGDPARCHPVAVFGWLAGGLERLLWRPSRPAGTVFCAALTAGSAAGVSAALSLLGSRPALRMALGAATVWTALGGRSLRREALRLGALLEQGDIEGARLRAPALVGRDPSDLDAGELARATVESVAENTADAIVASLLWFALGGAPATAAHRAVNTLDAMVGHRSARHAEFGWASARLDDAANWLPARLAALLTVLAAPVVDGSPGEAWRVLRRDGHAHPSPNAGRAEAAFAGALGVGLGGTNRYDDRIEHRAPLGDGRPPTVGRHRPGGQAVARRPVGRRRRLRAPRREAPALNVRVHGDRLVAPGSLDFAVNVWPGRRPAHLRRALQHAVASAAYPDSALRARPPPPATAGGPRRSCP